MKKFALSEDMLRTVSQGADLSKSPLIAKVLEHAKDKPGLGDGISSLLADLITSPYRVATSAATGTPLADLRVDRTSLSSQYGKRLSGRVLRRIKDRPTNVEPGPVPPMYTSAQADAMRPSHLGRNLLLGGLGAAGLGAGAYALHRHFKNKKENNMDKTSAIEAYAQHLDKVAAADYKGMVGGAMVGSLAGLPPGMGAILGARLRSGRGHGLGAAVADLKNSRRKKTAAFEAYQAMLKRAEGEEPEQVDPRHPALQGMMRGMGNGASIGGSVGVGLGALAARHELKTPAFLLRLLQGGLHGMGTGGTLGAGIGALSGMNKEKKDAWHAAMKQQGR